MTQTPHTPTPSTAADPQTIDPASAHAPTADAPTAQAVTAQAVTAHGPCLSAVDRAWQTATAARLRYANLAAAAYATLAALVDGDDPDPLEYLRDELAHPTPADPAKGTHPGSTGTAGDRGRG